MSLCYKGTFIDVDDAGGNINQRAFGGKFSSEPVTVCASGKHLNALAFFQSEIDYVKGLSEQFPLEFPVSVDNVNEAKEDNIGIVSKMANFETPTNKSMHLTVAVCNAETSSIPQSFHAAAMLHPQNSERLDFINETAATANDFQPALPHRIITPGQRVLDIATTQNTTCISPIGDAFSLCVASTGHAVDAVLQFVQARQLQDNAELKQLRLQLAHQHQEITELRAELERMRGQEKLGSINCAQALSCKAAHESFGSATIGSLPSTAAGEILFQAGEFVDLERLRRQEQLGKINDVQALTSKEAHAWLGSTTIDSLASTDAGESSFEVDVLADLSIAETAENPGSVGHPVLCSRPCMFYAEGKCLNGAACDFCHAAHPKRMASLDKRQRAALQRLTCADQFLFIAPVLKQKLGSVKQVADFLFELDDVCEHIRRCHPVSSCNENTKAMRQLTTGLKYLSAGQLNELLRRKASSDALINNFLRTCNERASEIAV